MICDIKSLRRELGLTQVEFAVQSGISLPTLQNIEAGKSNPSLDILQKVLSAVGLELTVEAPIFDVDKAILLGVPLAPKNVSLRLKPTMPLLKTEARKWVHYFRKKTFSEREAHAVTSFLCGLKDHWPRLYKEIDCKIFQDKISSLRGDGRLIKLRRIALSNMSKYL